MAVSGKSGKKIFNVAEASDSSSFYEHPLTKTVEKRQVDVTSLDDFLGSNRVDLVKIDTEGHELHVLEGMQGIIKANEDIKLFIEFNPSCLKNANTRPEDLFNKLVNLGFSIYFINDDQRKIHRMAAVDSWQELMGDKEYRNILCMKREKSTLVSFISHASEKNGAERSLLDIIDYCSDTGILSHVILPSKGPLEKELRNRPVSYDIEHFPWWINTNQADLADNEREILRCSIEIARTIRAVNPHIVYSNSSVSNVGALAAGMIQKPHIWHITEFGSPEHGIIYNLSEEERKGFINKYSDKVIFVSSALSDSYKRFIDDKKAEVIYNTVELSSNGADKRDSYFRKSDSIKLLLLGSFQLGKGIMEAVLAVNDLVKQNKGEKVELIIAGDVTSKQYYREVTTSIKENELDEYITIIDYVDEPYGLIKEADVMLVCSKDEAFGRATLEAMKLKKPVIGADSGATTELIKDKFNGLLYRQGDHKDLAEKILYLDRNKKKISEYGLNAYRFSEDNFNKTKTLLKIHDLIIKVKNESMRKKSPGKSIEVALFEYIQTKDDEIERLVSETIEVSNLSQARSAHIIHLEEVMAQKDAMIRQKDLEIRAMKSSILRKVRQVLARGKKIFR
jgi:glycosyltransferase involved in cell wall biosynthesis